MVLSNSDENSDKSIYAHILGELLPDDVKWRIRNEFKRLVCDMMDNDMTRNTSLMIASYYFSGCRNITQPTIIDITYLSVYFRIELRFEVFRFLGRTFKILRYEDQRAMISFNLQTERIDNEILNSNQNPIQDHGIFEYFKKC